MDKSAIRIVSDAGDNDPKNQFDEEIRDRLSNELIVALIGPVASGVSTTARLLKQKLESEYAYDVPRIIKVSEFIGQNARKLSIPLVEAPIDARITSYQDAGNRFRESVGNSILAKLAIREISETRHCPSYAG